MVAFRRLILSASQANTERPLHGNVSWIAKDCFVLSPLIKSIRNAAVIFCPANPFERESSGNGLRMGNISGRQQPEQPTRSFCPVPNRLGKRGAAATDQREGLPSAGNSGVNELSRQHPTRIFRQD